VTLPPYHWWRTVFWLIPAIATYTIVLGLVSLGASLAGNPFFAHRCAQWWARLILWTTGVTIERQGAPLPAASESCIVVANHASIYDIPILFTAIPRQLRIMAKSALGYVPFIGWHLRLSGHLLVNRTKPGAAIFKKMRRMAGSGASLIVFPEGGRSRDGALMKFKGGVFLLAIESGLPIVPVTIAGSRLVMPKGRLRTCPAAVRVTVHPPIATAGLSRDGARALADEVRGIIASGL
jgi:1-acyl-sn-glycerol-3-phosphate acyltransferase